MADPELLSRDQLEIAGYDGCSLTFDGRRRNGYFLVSHLLDLGEEVFVFQGGTPFDQRSENEALMAKIVGSFKAE